ncbi:hypothetical protein KIN20_033198 [Parelaphostrongylus tenuis]|uniref:Uncharacterized protein n=1 Tax=Parelaphostrongylus tenuis TaxID=148309 RepID=A0AAD5R7L9_PARTN|nr:hypothetical protein KIN20_033198 [Parelaphostrongylus tenuis]
MGLKGKEKSRLSTKDLEQSLSHKFKQVFQHLRHGALLHSSSSSAARTTKNCVIPADDVVYIASPNLSQLSTHFDQMKRVVDFPTFSLKHCFSFCYQLRLFCKHLSLRKRVTVAFIFYYFSRPRTKLIYPNSIS